MANYGSRPDNFLSFSKAERAFILSCLGVGFVLCLSGYWLPYVLPKEQYSEEDARELELQLVDFVARAAWEADSLVEVKAARRKPFYTDDFSNTGYKTERLNSSPSGSNRNFKGSAAQLVEINYALPLPALGSEDPNTIDSATILRLGVPRALMLRWLKFRSRGGTFVSRSDIAKVYGLQDSTFRRISKYFVEDHDMSAGFEVKRPRGEYIIDPVEVNMATIEELKKIKGIGNYYAKQITAYRERLGGFVRVDQVGETPNLRDSTFLAVREFLRVDANEVVRIPINHVDDKRLARHPYISASKAKTLFSYRLNHGPYKGVEDLYATEVVDSALAQKILPYISFD